MELAADVDLSYIAAETEGRTGAELEKICREAGMIALRKNLHAEQVTNEEFLTALNR
jgi:transitional endoplasmic reticulum ATPase